MVRVLRSAFAPGDEPLRRVSPSYQIFMLVLSVFSIVVLLLEFIFRRDAEVARVLERADSFVCLFFLGDFVYSLVKAPRKLRYLAIEASGVRLPGPPAEAKPSGSLTPEA